MSNLIKSEPDNEIRSGLMKVLLLVGFSEKNIPSDNESKLFLDENLRNMVFSKYSIEEVLQAIRLAMEGKITFDTRLYDKMISVAYFMDLMKEFDKWKKVVAPPKKELPSHQLTEDDKKNIVTEGVIKAFNNYKQYGRLALFNIGNTHYDFLKDKIELDEGTLNMLTEEAKENIKNKTSTTLETSRQELWERNRLKDIIQNIDKNVMIDEVERELCNLKLIFYFDELIEKNIDIKNIL